jgi:mannosyltransferase
VTLAAAPAREQPPEPTPIDAARRRRRPSWQAIAILGGIVVASAALRIEGIATWYWIDEALSVGIARHNLYEIPSLLLRDGSPPLYYLLLHGWTAVFGSSLTATHALSMVFALLTIPVAWFVARRLFGDRAAWLTAVLAATNPFITYFARETRMYALVVVLALVVAATFIEAFVDGRRQAIWWFGGSLLLLLYTHNWGLYTVVGCALALVPVVFLADDRRTVLRRAGAVFAVVGVAYLPWVPALLSQVANTGAPWSYTPSLRDVVRELAALFRDERVLALLALGAGVGLVGVFRQWRSRDAIAAASLGIIAMVHVGIGWTLAHVEPSWATRYLAVVLGPLLLLVGFGLARAGGVGVAAVAFACVLVLQPITRVNGLPLPRDAKSNAHALAARMGPRLDDGDLVLVAQPEAVPLLRTELGPELTYADPTGVVDDPTIMDWRDAEDRLRAAGGKELAALVEDMEVGQRVLLVAPGNEPSDTDTPWIELFRSAGRRAARALRADPRFVLVDRLRGPNEPYVTMDGAIWERVEP